MENYNYFISNREVIKNLAINTGTSANPVYTTICTTSEVNVSTELLVQLLCFLVLLN